MAATDNLVSLYDHEEGLRATSLEAIKADATLSDHWNLVTEAMNAIYAFTHDHVHKSEDELTLQYLGIRLFNAAGASVIGRYRFARLVPTVGYAGGRIFMAKARLKLVTPATVNRTVTPRRPPNRNLRTREHLTESEFTEGFDTLDLKEAKALLNELHA